ncbi:hypothetical protein QTP86_003816 [Hemibagrus guttatus]|nr:hypothetical protein QTP86_003816 [Hemibagrus guttatus]
MARRRMELKLLLLLMLNVCEANAQDLPTDGVNGFSLHPPYFNLAEGTKITATATCGEDEHGRPVQDLYCKLVGGPVSGDPSQTIQGQYCDTCDTADSNRAHPITNAIDGTERWWQSPPLSRSTEYNQVNVTLDLGQETRWKGSKTRSIGAGFKLFYYGVDSKRNGVGVVLKEEFVRNVLEVKRVSDRVMSLKLEIEGVMLNVVSGYAPQVGCELEEKERFWSELDEVMESIPTGERVVIGADFNGHVGEGNTGDEEVMGKFGVKERNLEGQMVVDFAKRMDMAVVNTYFQKREEHRVTYKSGGRSTQVDYILCRRGNLKEISDCKVVVGESVARQHRMVVCRMTLMVCKKKRSEIEIEKKTKWWKLKKEECCAEFRQKLRQALGGQVVLPDDWETTAEVIRETGRKVLGVSSGRRKEDKETWWWNEEVQDSIQRKRLAKKKWDMDRTEENRQEYKELQRRVKREVSKTKQKAYDELYTRLDTREGEKDLYRLARQKDRDGKDVQQLFHVAYVLIKFANSPRPDLWVRESAPSTLGRRTNPGSSLPRDCIERFGQRTIERINHDNDVICTTEYSRIVPLENGEIVVSLVNGRPGAMNFSYSPVLREFTKATNIRLRFLRTNTLLGHLMGIALRDPTVTRRYYYSIKDISIGGRCVCNGHAEACNAIDPNNPYNPCPPSISALGLIHLHQHNQRAPSAQHFVPKQYRPNAARGRRLTSVGGGWPQSDLLPPRLRRDSLRLTPHRRRRSPATPPSHPPFGGFRPSRAEVVARLDYASGDFARLCCSVVDVAQRFCSAVDVVLDPLALLPLQCDCQHNTCGPSCDRCCPGFNQLPWKPATTYSANECEQCNCHRHSFQCYYDPEVDQRRASLNMQGEYQGGGVCMDCQHYTTGNNCERCVPGYYRSPDHPLESQLACSKCLCESDFTDGTCEDLTGRCYCKPNYTGVNCNTCAEGYENFPACYVVTPTFPTNLNGEARPAGEIISKTYPLTVSVTQQVQKGIRVGQTQTHGPVCVNLVSQDSTATPVPLGTTASIAIALYLVVVTQLAVVCVGQSLQPLAVMSAALASTLIPTVKYLGVVSTSEGRMDGEIDRRIGAAAAVTRSMYWSVVGKKELSRKAKLSIYQSIYVPTLTYGHELWVMTERIRSRIQAAEMSFLRRVAGCSATQEELGVEPLLLHITRGQLRWLGHLFQMPPGRLPGEVFRACPTGKRPRGRPRTRWRDYVSRLTWERLGIPPEELEEVSVEREVGASLLRLLPS